MAHRTSECARGRMTHPDSLRTTAKEPDDQNSADRVVLTTAEI
jgi:hypothetical protein